MGQRRQARNLIHRWTNLSKFNRKLRQFHRDPTVDRLLETQSNRPIHPLPGINNHHRGGFRLYKQYRYNLYWLNGRLSIFQQIVRRLLTEHRSFECTYQ